MKTNGLCLSAIIIFIWALAPVSARAQLQNSSDEPSCFLFRSQNIMDPLRTKSYEKLWPTPPTALWLSGECHSEMQRHRPRPRPLTNLVRMRGLLPDLLHHWLLLDRGRVRHIAAEFLAELRSTTRINLCVIASARERDIGHTAVEQILGAQFGVHVNQDTVGSLSLAGVAGHCRSDFLHSEPLG
jgi:hypothetical protein